MAQVTVSGSLGFGHESVTSQANNSAGAKTKVSGMRNVVSAIRFTATEDLGNGLKATASMQITANGRSANSGTAWAASNQDANSVQSEDASITVSGGFGAVTIGAVEAGNGIVGLGQAGAPVRGFHNAYNSTTGSLLAGASNVDLLQYTSPTFSGVTLRAQMIDDIGGPGAGGQQEAKKAMKATAVGIRYAAGPLTVDADKTDFKVNGAVNAAAGTAANGLAVAAAADAYPQISDRTRISAGYNLGVARVGFGYESRTHKTSATASKKATDTIMGVSVPMGAITLGATYGTSKLAGEANKASGTEFGAKYDFSKRTALTAQMGSFKKADTSKQSITRVRLDHTF
jgi:hypothetical protein